MNAETLWAEFCQKKNIDINTPYEAWAFCGGGKDGDELADLVLAGRKFGTASAYDEYVLEDALDEIPKTGDYSVILKDNDEAVCVIRTYDVYTRAFFDVSPFHGYSEGEGNRSLSYWRDVHRRAFAPTLVKNGIEFTEETRIICEKFSVEYIPGKQIDDDELLFVEPTMEYADEIMAYRKEMLEAESSFDGCFSMKRHDNPQAFVNHCIEWSNPRRPADEHGAWGNVIMAIRKSDKKMVGCFQAHNVLTERMEKYTGHVGYSVRPSERKKGYATKLLAKAKDFLSSFGFDEITVACLPDNEGSRKTIIANGGAYIETIFLEEDGVNLERYVIKL